MTNNSLTEIHFSGTSRTLQLQRYPLRDNETLRAWNAADEYILTHIAENLGATAPKNILIVNDSYGAIALGLMSITALVDTNIHSLSDSVISHCSVKKNVERNALDSKTFKLVASKEFSGLSVADEFYDLVIIKTPKSLAQLEDNLRRIRPRISTKTVVIGAGMTKAIHNSTLSLFEACIGATKSSLARKKARLIFSEVATETSQVEPLPAAVFEIDKQISQTEKNLVIASLPGVFSHGKLDLGTKFLLGIMPISHSSIDILDLGCGSGALGIAAAMRAPETNVTFVDESYAAIESVKESLILSLGENANGSIYQTMYQTIVSNCLDDIADQSQDLILNNPPFHDAAARVSSIALDMFRDSKRVLRTGGHILVVANRHLNYNKRLAEIFGNCSLLAENNKFVVLRAVKR